MEQNDRFQVEDIPLTAKQVALIQQNLAKTRGSTGFFESEFILAVSCIENLVRHSMVVQGVLDGTIGIDVQGDQVIFFERSRQG